MPRAVTDWLSMPGVSDDLAAELDDANLSPGEEAEVIRIINAWGEEDVGPGWTRDGARADLAERVRDYLRGEAGPFEDESDGFDPNACPGCGGNCARACR